MSEGQGYGMLIVAYLAGSDPRAQEIFDGLWEFALDHPSSIDPRLMDFEVPFDEAPQPGNDDSAFDGDADMAFALLLADRQWGSRGGRFDYRAEARRVIAGLRESTVGPESRLPLLGDWVDPAGETFNQWTTRPSDFLPTHFRAFARATNDPTWTRVFERTRQTVTRIQSVFSPLSGLLSDFLVQSSAADTRPRPAPPDFLEGPNDGAYFYNAGRVPWRLGFEAVLTPEPTVRTQVRKISRWARTAAAGDPQNVRSGYRLDGTPLPDSDFFSSFFAAPLGVAAMVTAGQRPWLEATYEAVRTREENYYEDSVTLLAMLVMTGNAWQP